MITVSLREIRAKEPCVYGWRKLLEYKGGKNADLDLQFPITDILESNNLDDTLWVLRCRPEHANLWRKFAVWAARQVEHLADSEASSKALDVAWRHSNGEATDSELAAAWTPARHAAWAEAWDATRSAAREAARSAAWSEAGHAAWAAAWAATRAAASPAQKQKLIEILSAGEWVE